MNVDRHGRGPMLAAFQDRNGLKPFVPSASPRPLPLAVYGDVPPPRPPHSDRTDAHLADLLEECVARRVAEAVDRELGPVRKAFGEMQVRVRELEAETAAMAKVIASLEAELERRQQGTLRAA